MIILSLVWRLFEEMTAFSYEKYKISINSKIPKSQILFYKKEPTAGLYQKDFDCA